MSISKSAGIVLLSIGLLAMAYNNQWVGGAGIVIGALVVLGSARSQDHRS
jgi:hypothetical protein